MDRDLFTAAAIVAAGGFMRGFSGFGSNMVMAPLLSLVYGPINAVMTAILLDLSATLALAPGAARQAHWREILPLIVASCLFLPLGAWLLLALDAEIMRRAIAALVVLTAALFMAGWRYRGRRGPGPSAVVGAMSGVVGGATSMGGPPVILYLLSGDDSAAKIRANLNAMSVVLLGVAAGGYAIGGIIDSDTLLRAVVLLPVMLLFTALGSRVFARIGDEVYRRAALCFLLVIGVMVLIL